MVRPKLFTRIRQWLAFKIYKAPRKEDRNPGWLSTRGIFEYALDSTVKREIVRELAYHVGTRRYYGQSNNSLGIGVVAEYATYDSDFPVSTDMTDYDSGSDYFNTVQKNKKEHISKFIQELCECKVIEVYVDNEVTKDYDYKRDGIPEGIQPGARFEYAVQALKWADIIGSERTWANY